MHSFSNALVWASAALVVVACSSDDDSNASPGGEAQTRVESQVPTSGDDSESGDGSGADGAGAGEASANEASADGDEGSATDATSEAAGGGGSEGPSEGTELEPGAAGPDGSPDTGADGDTSGEVGAEDADSPEAEPEPEVEPEPDDETMSFFATSRGSGSGGDFGGIEGADALCAQLATEASPELGQKTWRAYLSTSSEDARDRIGTGPWRNAAGVIIANSLEQLHDQGPTGEGGSLDATWPLNDPNVALDELGNPIQQDGGTRHDVLTGSNVDGTVSASGTCSDWTSQQGTTRNGHSDRVRFMQNIPSWNSSHDTGCGEPAPGGNFQAGTVSQGGGRGSIYCFAAD